jgi:hypothetical protein
MNWPADFEDFECVGFSSELASILAEAWDNKHVEIVRSGRAGSYFHWAFDYLGFRYRVDCEEQMVERDGRTWAIYNAYRLEKVAKLDVDDDGNTIVIEEYPMTTPKQFAPKPRYEGVWATF